jgi:hypothetical protein
LLKVVRVIADSVDPTSAGVGVKAVTLTMVCRKTPLYVGFVWIMTWIKGKARPWTLALAAEKKKDSDQMGAMLKKSGFPTT